jgi:arylsulfatase A-like enzyme
VFKEWADRYRGRFDQGYEAIRPAILDRQKELGLLPQDTELSAINPHGEPDGITGPAGQPWPQLDFVRPWDSLNADEQRLFVRMAEVYAGFVSYTDDQIGRLIDYLADSGQLDNTIIMVTSDNGASGEGGPNGSFNENKIFNGQPDTIEANLSRIDDLGGPSAYNHYNTGWAWAFDTPFPYWKRFAGYEGGVADMLIVAWPKEIAARGEVRHQYIHAVDLVPTVYEMLEVTAPEVLKGHTQSEIEGRSFTDSFTDPAAAGRDTQFYTMLGMRAIYRDGWLANTLHPPISGWANFEKDRWELYNLEEDRAQHRDVAAQHPERLEQLKGLWYFYAGQYKGLPLDDRSPIEIFATPRPQPTPPRTRYVYYPDSAEVPESVSPNIRRRSFAVAAGVDIADPDAAGVLFKAGTAMGGHALFVKDRRLHYVNNWLGEAEQLVSSQQEVEPGRHVLTAEFKKTGDDPQTFSAVGSLTLYIDTEAVGSAEIRTQPGIYGLGGGIVVGRNPGSPVTTHYGSDRGFAFTGGAIEQVVFDVSGDEFVDHQAEVLRWLVRD